MNKILRRVFLVVGAAFLIFAVLTGLGMFQRGIPWLGGNFWACQFWGSLVAGTFLIVGAFKLKQGLGLNVMLLVVSAAFVEGALQVAAMTGLLPGVFSTKPKCPYGRVYYTYEGFGNSVRNKHGWYAGNFNLQASRKIAVIGDSFVEALEVHRSKTFSALLQGELRQSGSNAAVLPLGNMGTSPAHYLTVLEYAWKHFQPDEVVLCFYVGNDVSDSSPRLNTWPAGHFFYHDWSQTNGATLSAEDEKIQQRYFSQLEFSHQSPIYTLSETLGSHCMTLQTALTLKESFRRRKANEAVKNHSTTNALAGQLSKLGINARVFETPSHPEVQAGLENMLGTLPAASAYCRERGMTLRVVVIPFFPPVFYETQSGTNWTLQLGRYDFEMPQRRVLQFCGEQKIPALDLTQVMRSRRLAVQEIQRLYHVQGSGHFTELGHNFTSQAISKSFYAREVSHESTSPRQSVISN